MGAALALGGITGCTPRPPEGFVVPYVRAPEDVIPGRPLFYATAMATNGYALGLLVESHLGRPTKIEGNPMHPASLGATDAFAQASVLDLYDPDRSAAVLGSGEIQSWARFVNTAQFLRTRFEGNGGAGLFILTEAVTSPTLIAQINELLTRMPRARWYRYELVAHDGARAGSVLAFGLPVESYYRFDRADVVLSLDADIFAGDAHSVRYAHDFAERRRVRAGSEGMSRLYSIGGSPNLTSAIADHRLPLRTQEVDISARALAAALGVAGFASDTAHAQFGADSDNGRFLAAVAADLQAHRGRSIVMAGAYQPASVHALAHAINDALGNTGETIAYLEPIVPSDMGELDSLGAVTQAMAGGEVELLLMLGGNPVYSAPADLQFQMHLAKVQTSVHVSPYVDETSSLTTWHVPASHFLETWSDLRAFDGTASIVQPLIAPLYDGKSAHEVLAAFSPQPTPPAYDLVKNHWREMMPGGGADDDAFELRWQVALHDGVVPDTAAKLVTPALRADALSALPAVTAAPGNAIEIVFRPDPTVHDGRFARNAWLQELPKPLTKLTWDNAILVAPRTAARLGVDSDAVVSIDYRGRRVTGPVLVLPGHAEESITLHLGYGRRIGGDTTNEIGFDANRLRTSDAPWRGIGAVVTPLGQRYELATTQLHFVMEGRDFVRAGTFAELRAHPHFARDREPPPRDSLYPEWRYQGRQWGMSIDNTVCTGCSACVIACQSENNVPSVGKEGVLRQREMHWLRIDQYYQGDPSNPRSFFQPMLCQHCENAPCEVVCPVAATSHSEDGLNQMVYNRCVGTRYCSNNCPYKVRRFNFFDYRRGTRAPSLALLANPDVTVRTLGVMEKCTYCIQRIKEATIDAERENRDLRDGDIVTACEAACPTRAIVFGDINADSRVAALKKEPHDYQLLAELNVRPRTSYLAALRNPNPALAHDTRGHEENG
jgi:molybdopterin-containing oxidoreductase family iron-sulfur binding subunit